MWNPKDSSTGLQRRIIYIEMSTTPKVVDRNLFHYDLVTNEISGTLAKDLPGLINWALNNPKSNLNLLNNAVETNKLISSNTMGITNPLIEWIETYLEFNLNSEVPVGKVQSNPDTHLFANYLRFCKDYGYHPLKYSVFSDTLVQQLQTLFDLNIRKYRNSKNTVISGISLYQNSTNPN
jgi:hypothetical protein